MDWKDNNHKVKFQESIFDAASINNYWNNNVCLTAAICWHALVGKSNAPLHLSKCGYLFKQTILAISPLDDSNCFVWPKQCRKANKLNVPINREHKVFVCSFGLGRSITFGATHDHHCSMGFEYSIYVREMILHRKVSVTGMHLHV